MNDQLFNLYKTGNNYNFASLAQLQLVGRLEMQMSTY